MKKREKKSTSLKFEAQRTVVSQLWANNIQKPAEIIRLTGFPKSTVYDLVNRLKERSLPIPGRHPILTVKQRRHLGQIVQNNNAATAAGMTERLKQKDPNLKVSVCTVQRTFKKKLLSLKFVVT